MASAPSFTWFQEELHEFAIISHANLQPTLNPLCQHPTPTWPKSLRHTPSQFIPTLSRPPPHHKNYLGPPPTSNSPTFFPQTSTHQKSSGAQSYPLPPQKPTPTINNNPTISTPPRFTSHTPSSYTIVSSITTSLPSSSIQNLEDKVALQGLTIDTGLTSTRPIRRTFRPIWLKDYI